MQPSAARLRATFVHLAGTLGNLLLAPRLSAPFPLFGERPSPSFEDRSAEREIADEREVDRAQRDRAHRDRAHGARRAHRAG